MRVRPPKLWTRGDGLFKLECRLEDAERNVKRIKLALVEAEKEVEYFVLLVEMKKREQEKKE